MGRWIILGLVAVSAYAQYYFGYHSSSYAGVGGIQLQPADVADSRLMVDVALIGTDFKFGNNYLELDRATLFDWNTWNDPNFLDKYTREKLKDLNDKAFLYMGYQLQLPSVLITLSEYDGIAFVPRLRALLNVDNFDYPLAHQIYTGIEDSLFWKRRFEDDFVSIQFNFWAEYGLTYGRVLIDEDEHFLKMGISTKLLQGLGSAYAFMYNFRYSFLNDTLMDVFQTDLYYGHSTNFELDRQKWKYRFIANPSVALDFGVVYEWRKNYQRYKYDMDGKTGLWRRDKDKYFLKVGLALIDLGRIRYTKAPGSRNLKVDIRNWNLHVFDTVKTQTAIQQIDSILNNTFQIVEEEGQPYNMNLPTNLVAQVDMHATDGLAFNLTGIIPLNAGTKDIHKNHFFRTLIFTPRAENKWVGIGFPITIDNLTGFRVGSYVRLGPFVLGSQDIFGWMVFQDYLQGFNIYFLAKVPIPFSMPKDMDGDKVSDKLDECIDVPGVWEFKGCPDSDKDGIQDSEDDCPLVPGIARFNGCPDTDGDGIQDKEDKCPSTPGLPELQGCPDSDGDGITDSEDKCPDVKGPKENQGCPDTDGDGIIDPHDQCPTVPGKAEFAGCPDTDNDGIEDRIDQCPHLPGPKEKFGCPDSDGDGLYDNEDKCPNIPGPPDNLGCPYADTDGDGIRDRDDACPELPGPPENKGCPHGDRDGDGIRDTDDACPDLPGPPENKGCPYTDTDKDGIPDIFDKCPMKPGPKEYDGCPDSDQDSIPDHLDKCPQTPGTKANNGCPELEEEEKEILNRVFENLEFEIDSDVIRPESYPALMELAELLKRKPNYRLLVEGHTDNTGSREYNIRLSERRAEAVKRFLVKQGISPDRIITRGWGPDRPIAPNDTPEGRQKNRRVEFTILFEGQE